VPIVQGFVQVAGAILRPGYYPFHKGKSIEYYVELAGGATGDDSEITTLVYDRVSGLTHISQLVEDVSDGDRIMLRQEESNP